MEERRATPRRRVFKAGSIEFDGASVDCTIRNLSPAGASLDIASPVGIPHEITLNMVTHQTRQRGYIVWRKERRVGMAFDPSQPFEAVAANKPLSDPQNAAPAANDPPPQARAADPQP
jgi:hypothetical protein